MHYILGIAKHDQSERMAFDISRIKSVGATIRFLSLLQVRGERRRQYVMKVIVPLIRCRFACIREEGEFPRNYRDERGIP